MSARISVEGDAIDVSARFESEAEIDGFITRLWSIFFILHPEAANEAAAKEITDKAAVVAGLDPAMQEGGALRPGVDFRNEAIDGAVDLTAQQSEAEAFARLTPTQRRAVLLKRKLGAVAKVAKEMGVTDASVYQHLKAAREKGVAV